MDNDFEGARSTGCPKKSAASTYESCFFELWEIVARLHDEDNLEKGFHSISSYWWYYMDDDHRHRFSVSCLVLPVLCYIFYSPL